MAGYAPPEREMKLADPVVAQLGSGYARPVYPTATAVGGKHMWKLQESKSIGRDLPSVAPLLHRDIFHIPTAWDKRTAWALEDGRPMMAGVR